MRKEISGVTVELETGDISSQAGMDAVVNAANAELMPGGGVAGAIHRAAGPGLAEECSRYAPIKPGEAVVTAAHNLPNMHVIHCLGPVYGLDEPAAELLSNCYRNALRLAEEKEIASLAFPSISTGAFGYPVEEAAKIAASAVSGEAEKLVSVKKIRFVLFSPEDLGAYAKAFSEV